MERLSKRRKFINLVNRTLENLLFNDGPDEEQYLDYEEELIDEVEEQRQRLALRTRQINELRSILSALPRAMRRVATGRVMTQIRDYIHDIRLENMPQDLLDMINEIL